MGRGIHHRTREIIEGAQGILAEQQPMTLRQLFYRLVSVTLLKNTPGDYGKLSRILTGARERGAIPYEWIVDRSRPTYAATAWENPADYAHTMRNAYRRNYWQDQPAHVEVWTEKDAIIGSIEPVTDKWGVTIRVTRGFMSTTRAHEIAEAFDGMHEKRIRILYLGDHDPSGRCIEEDAARRVREQMVEGYDDATRSMSLICADLVLFQIERIAIHAQDIRDFDLPPLRIKATDSRARAFRRQHGSACVELDALPVTELRARLDEAIRGFVDLDAWRRAEAVEAVEIASIKTVCDRMTGAGA
jgi:hypothetical protein